MEIVLFIIQNVRNLRDYNVLDWQEPLCNELVLMGSLFSAVWFVDFCLFLSLILLSNQHFHFSEVEGTFFFLFKGNFVEPLELVKKKLKSVFIISKVKEFNSALCSAASYIHLTEICVLSKF
ncbi:hypothetical protein Csa_002110 [Cucumis sativus]|uniref:Uncharacterized protein n=1 Tax=Cucumis sativus TaxID=3659 RepID=A0A0A0LDU7_CUCSA|nr:hypothetical protein Csa_002110 [Cucumis sativus]